MIYSSERFGFRHSILPGHGSAVSKRWLCRFQAQARSHAEVLGRFERDLALLAAVAILPGAQTEQLRTLADLVPQEQYRDWAAKCSACHDNLASKVGELLLLLCLAMTTSPAMWEDCCSRSACHVNLASTVGALLPVLALKLQNAITSCMRCAADRQEQSAHECGRLQTSTFVRHLS